MRVTALISILSFHSLLALAHSGAVPPAYIDDYVDPDMVVKVRVIKIFLLMIFTGAVVVFLNERLAKGTEYENPLARNYLKVIAGVLVMMGPFFFVMADVRSLFII